MHQKDIASSEPEVFDDLIRGNFRFIGSNKEFRGLSETQCPDYVVIACSDSRVSPSIITDSPLGKLFEIRIAGGVLDTAAIASVEFALENLRIRGILVLGHTDCGAVKAAQKLFLKDEKVDPAEDIQPLRKIVGEILDTISKNDDNRNDLTKAVKDNTVAQMETLLNNKSVKRKLDAGSLKVSAALYNLETGKLDLI